MNPSSTSSNTHPNATDKTDMPTPVSNKRKDRQLSSGLFDTSSDDSDDSDDLYTPKQTSNKGKHASKRSPVVQDSDDESDKQADSKSITKSSNLKRKSDTRSTSSERADTAAERDRSEETFNENFEKQVGHSDVIKLKYPTKEKMKEYIDMLDESTPQLSDTASNEYKKIFKRTHRQYVVSEKEGKTILMSKPKKKIPSAPIVAMEDLFSTLFSECTKEPIMTTGL